MTITILGDCPSKKNQKRIFRNKYTGKPFITSSQRHKDWHSKAIRQLDDIRPVQGVKRVTLSFYPQTKRRSDLTNRADSIMDLLVDGGVLEDDSWFVVPNLALEFGGVDKLNPRVEVEIE